MRSAGQLSADRHRLMSRYTKTLGLLGFQLHCHNVFAELVVLEKRCRNDAGEGMIRLAGGSVRRSSQASSLEHDEGPWALVFVVTRGSGPRQLQPQHSIKVASGSGRYLHIQSVSTATT